MLLVSGASEPSAGTEDHSVAVSNPYSHYQLCRLTTKSCISLRSDIELIKVLRTMTADRSLLSTHQTTSECRAADQRVIADRGNGVGVGDGSDHRE